MFPKMTHRHCIDFNLPWCGFSHLHWTGSATIAAESVMTAVVCGAAAAPAAPLICFLQFAKFQFCSNCFARSTITCPTSLTFSQTRKLRLFQTLHSNVAICSAWPCGSSCNRVKIISAVVLLFYINEIILLNNKLCCHTILALRQSKNTWLVSS